MRRLTVVLSLLCCALAAVLPSTAGGTDAGPRTMRTAPDSPAGVFVPITPTRGYDTRPSGFKAVGGVATTITLAGVPPTAIAVDLNVTVTEPVAAGYITLAPARAPLPLASNLNFVAGETTANHAVVAADGGQITALPSVDTHLVLDVSGYWIAAPGPASAGRFVAVHPTRVLDTRTSLPPFKVGGSGWGVALAAAGVPADATAVAVTITATEPDAAGYVTAWASGSPPFVSTLNFLAGQTIANSALVPVVDLGASPWIKVLASAPAFLVIDVSGYLTGPSAAAGTQGRFVAAAPARVLDTRDGTGRLAPPDSVGCSDFDRWSDANEWFWTYSAFGDPFALDANADNIPCESLPGRAAVATPVPLANARLPRNAVIPVADPRAAGVSAVVVNLTVTAPAAAGFITAYPAGSTRPWASNVNPAYPGHTRPGLAIVGAGTGGQVFVYTSGATHLVADAAGWFQ